MCHSLVSYHLLVSISMENCVKLVNKFKSSLLILWIVISNWLSFFIIQKTIDYSYWLVVALLTRHQKIKSTYFVCVSLGREYSSCLLTAFCVALSSSPALVLACLSIVWCLWAMKPAMRYRTCVRGSYMTCTNTKKYRHTDRLPTQIRWALCGLLHS